MSTSISSLRQPMPSCQTTVRHRVRRAAVVERVPQLGPDVRLEIREVGVVERLQQLSRHQLHDVAAAEPDEDVVRDSARRELRDRLVGGLVRPGCDLAVELLPELLDEPRVDVVGVVVDPERPTLRCDPVGQHRVVIRDRPLDAVVVPRQRQPARPHRLRDDQARGAAVPAGARSVAAAAGLGTRVLAEADRRRRVLARDERSGNAGAGRSRGRTPQKLTACDSRSVLRMPHRPAFMRRRPGPGGWRPPLRRTAAAIPRDARSGKPAPRSSRTPGSARPD